MKSTSKMLYNDNYIDNKPRLTTNIETVYPIVKENIFSYLGGGKKSRKNRKSKKSNKSKKSKK